MRSTQDHIRAAENTSPHSKLTFGVATEPRDFEQIARLNYQTFVEEIPQHEPNEEHRRVDPFLDRGMVFICRDGDRIVGMMAFSSERPFSLDQKLDDLERSLRYTIALDPEYVTLYRMRYKGTRVHKEMSDARLSNIASMHTCKLVPGHMSRDWMQEQIRNHPNT